MARRRVLVYDKTTTSNLTNDVGSSVKIQGMGPPFMISMQVDALGTNPTGSLSFTADGQDGEDGTVFATIGTSAFQASLSSVDAVNFDNHTTGTFSFGQFFRANVNASAATAWNDGVRIRVWLHGDASK